MKKVSKPSKFVAGFIARASRPMPLGAAMMAIIITFPIGVMILLVDLLLF